jgi:tRNA nucleotidyltransferase (CCA-adding enzyme)
MSYPFYKVGGCVRDQFLGITSKDIDYAVEAPSFDAMREAILARGGKIFVETPEHFTIRANVPELGACDYVLCRKDGPYSDGRRPDWVQVGTLADDLARRDFRMNAIAITEKGEVIDPHNGRKDIQDRVIQAVGDPWERLIEDKLRAFRAIRFCVTKRFVIEDALNAAISGLSMDSFTYTSTERIRDELAKMFKHDSYHAMGILLKYPNMLMTAKKRGIWFLPTTEKP